MIISLDNNNNNNKKKYDYFSSSSFVLFIFLLLHYIFSCLRHRHCNIIIELKLKILLSLFSIM